MVMHMVTSFVTQSQLNIYFNVNIYFVYILVELMLISYNCVHNYLKIVLFNNNRNTIQKNYIKHEFYKL